MARLDAEQREEVRALVAAEIARREAERPPPLSAMPHRGGLPAPEGVDSRP